MKSIHLTVTGVLILCVAVLTMHFEFVDDFIAGTLFGLAIAFNLLGLILRKK